MLDSDINKKRLYMYMLNNKGPKTDPCGTPVTAQ